MTDYTSEAREPGARRRKLAGYLKAANELRQSYQQSYTSGWGRRDATFEDADDGTPGAFPDAAVIRSGDEEMILFPSYARKHVKSRPQAQPGTIQETPGDGRDVRDSTGEGDAEFWKQQWENYEDDHAVVDVDIRGWIYSPHKGQMTRKQRLFIGVARQLVGIQAPPAGTSTKLSPSASPGSSRNPSPHMGHRERAEARAARRDAELTAKEAENILQKGEKEVEIASKGGFSERPAEDDADGESPYTSQSRDSSPADGTRRPSHMHHLAHTASSNSLKNDENITALQKRASWNQPSDMSPTELAEANAHLMARLRHFLAIPMANEPISMFFYNEEVSKQRTVYTNPSGHFNLRAALDFVPTHVRILASDRLSATEEITIIDPKGVSLISDIDDTIKHSAITSGAREIFRNAFIRELGDLTIEGVKDWYSRMADMGVKFHYVSNSPWQLYPVLSTYFAMAGLPSGSFHLKQYSGMLQGIFEPVAERKKGTLDKIARDFPERRFILVGDSGEADLEVYTEFVLENPGRVLAVFIRDVTTSISGGFFDPSMGPMTGDRSSNTSQRGQGNAVSFNRKASVSGVVEEEDDPELKAAIAASLRDMEDEHRKILDSPLLDHSDDSPERRPELPPRKSTQSRPPPPVEKLIDFSDEESEMPDSSPPLRRTMTDTGARPPGRNGSIASTTSAKSMPPMPPKKPVALRSTSGENTSPSSASKAPPPPKPRRPSSTVHASSPLTNEVQNQKPNTKPKAAPKPTISRSQQSYAGIARDKLSSAYNNLPSASAYLHSGSSVASSTDSTSAMSTSSETGAKKPAPPPPPPRRGISSYPVAAASYASTKVSNAWNGSANPYSTTSASQYPQRAGNSNLGANGGANVNGGANGQILNKKEQLWRQRWARAEQVLGEKGVVLKSWRIGSDVMKDAIKLVEEAKRKEETAGNRKGSVR